MLTESTVKKKYLPLLFFLIFSLTIPAEGKGKNNFLPKNPIQKDLNNNSTDRFIFGISYFNAFRDRQNALEGRFEYRSVFSLFNLSPFAGITFTTAGSFYGMAGFYSDIPIGKNFIFTPSFAAGYFNKGMGIDLAYELEFRTQLEITYILQNHSRIGFGFYHISNGNLGKSNPGAETFTFLYSVPIN